MQEPYGFHSTSLNTKPYIMAGSEDTALNPSRILEVVLASLRGDGQTEPSIKNAYEAIALVGHASMVATQFRLIGLGEEQNIGT